MRHPDERWRWAALGGVLGPVAFVTAWAVGGVVREVYDPGTDAISRLAAVTSDTRWLMSGGFACFAIGAIVASTAIRRAVAGWSWLSLAAAGAATAGAGLAPLEHSSGVDLVHGLVATLGYATFVGAAALAAAPLARDGHRGLARLSVGAAVLGAVLLASTTVVTLDGYAQRAGLGVLDVWLASLSVAVLTGRVGPAAPAGSRESSGGVGASTETSSPEGATMPT